MKPIKHQRTGAKQPGLRRKSFLNVVSAALFLLAAYCSSPQLGPKDGGDLPPNDLNRIQVGSEAPDFTLQDADGNLVTLSDFRKSHHVVLVFYRGHW